MRISETPAQIVARYQKGRGLGDAEMGGALGVSRQTVWNWRRGKIEPSIEQIERLSKQFGVSDWQFQMAMDLARCELAITERRIRGAINGLKTA